MKRTVVRIAIVFGTVTLGWFFFTYIKSLRVTPGLIADWSFIESVGGISLGQPRKLSQGIWIVPVKCDISERVTKKPNWKSGAIIQRINYRLDNKTLKISLSIYARTKTEENSRCPDLKVENILPGKYDFVYSTEDGSHFLGTRDFTE